MPAALADPHRGCHITLLGQHVFRAVGSSGEHALPGVRFGGSLPRPPAQRLRGAEPAGVSAALHGTCGIVALGS